MVETRASCTCYWTTLQYVEMISTGRNLTMRHFSKTKGISVARLHQICEPDDVLLRYISTSLMAAGIFTKMFTDKIKWIYICMLGGFGHGPKTVFGRKR